MYSPQRSDSLLTQSFTPPESTKPAYMSLLYNDYLNEDDYQHNWQGQAQSQQPQPAQSPRQDYPATPSSSATATTSPPSAPGLAASSASFLQPMDPAAAYHSPLSASSAADSMLGPFQASPLDPPGDVVLGQGDYLAASCLDPTTSMPMVGWTDSDLSKAGPGLVFGIPWMGMDDSFGAGPRPALEASTSSSFPATAAVAAGTPPNPQNPLLHLPTGGISLASRRRSLSTSSLPQRPSIFPHLAAGKQANPSPLFQITSASDEEGHDSLESVKVDEIPSSSSLSPHASAVHMSVSMPVSPVAWPIPTTAAGSGSAASSPLLTSSLESSSLPDYERLAGHLPRKRSSSLPPASSSSSTPQTPTLANTPQTRLAVQIPRASRPRTPGVITAEEQQRLDDELERVDFGDITVTELKDMLRQRGKSATGKKAVLMQRLRDELEVIRGFKRSGLRRPPGGGGGGGARFDPYARACGWNARMLAPPPVMSPLVTVAMAPAGNPDRECNMEEFMYLGEGDDIKYE
ncbi:uncharacterized protein VTP21DRAFT_7192 [Calcarisporiella thermophila]|uniref:uncharacterized protein n=1 Tax=Calcarisporiella thermophila TaxID=911321 RepID=UPI003742450A